MNGFNHDEVSIKVLVVEDNPITSLDIKEILSENGMTVIGTATTGREALSEIRSKCPDVVLMDIKLADEIDGVSVAKELLQTSHFPVIYITANSDIENKSRAFDTNPAGFLTKPFNERDLLNLIELSFINHSKRVMNNKSVPEMNESLFLKMGDKYEKVSVHNILYIEADGSYSKVFTESKSYSLSINLYNVLNKINNPLFFRTHRSHIVNLERITSFDRHHVFIGKTAIPYSKNCKADLMLHLQKL